LVLLDEARRVTAEALIARAQHQELRADRLDERGDAERLVHARCGVADAELDRREGGVRAQVPPDLPAVFDALRPDQELDEVLVLVVGGELRRYPGAGEALPDDLAVRLESRDPRQPERARGRDREQVREEIPRLVHDLDAQLGVGDADVHVQSEDQQLADDVLQLLLEDLVALGLGYVLVLPVRERMRAGRGDTKARRLQQRRDRAAQGRDLVTGLAHVGADLRAGLDDRLHHLALELVAEAAAGSREERLDVALELTLPIDDLELLLDADRETRDVVLLHRPTARERASLIIL